MRRVTGGRIEEPVAERQKLRGRVTERRKAEQERRKTWGRQRGKNRQICVGMESDTEFRTKYGSEARIAESLMKYI